MCTRSRLAPAHSGRAALICRCVAPPSVSATAINAATLLSDTSPSTSMPATLRLPSKPKVPLSLDCAQSTATQAQSSRAVLAPLSPLNLSTRRWNVYAWATDVPASMTPCCVALAPAARPDRLPHQNTARETPRDHGLAECAACDCSVVPLMLYHTHTLDKRRHTHRSPKQCHHPHAQHTTLAFLAAHVASVASPSTTTVSSALLPAARSPRPPCTANRMRSACPNPPSLLAPPLSSPHVLGHLKQYLQQEPALIARRTRLGASPTRHLLPPASAAHAAGTPLCRLHRHRDRLRLECVAPLPSRTIIEFDTGAPPRTPHDAAVLITCPSLPLYLSPTPASLMPGDFGAHHPPRVQRSRRPFFVAAAPAHHSHLQQAPRTPRSRAGPARPVPYPIAGAALVAFSPAVTVYGRTRAPIPRRPHERRGLGLRLPDISALLRAASATQDRDSAPSCFSPKHTRRECGKVNGWQKSGPVLPAHAATGLRPTGDLALPMLG
ncbi:hypothetical protein B0H13DRAFT_2662229 [Mycena leptocephala]|nr:hypothetical protein B0H13DRAFT_2662229 [Mycena leptocephala]